MNNIYHSETLTHILYLESYYMNSHDETRQGDNKAPPAPVMS